MFDSVMRRLNRTSLRTFHDEAFIWNAKSFCQIFLTLTCLLSSTVGVGSHYVEPGHVPFCDLTGVLLQYARIWLLYTPVYHSRLGCAHDSYSSIVSEVLHIPRVAHPDYPCSERLRIVSKDELASLFCETPSSWGDHQNTSCSAFAKGPRFLNMVMTFILHPLSHYNTITEPYAWFLLSVIEGLTIDFASHFILSLIDVYRDMTTHDKLIFPSAITRLLRHFSVSYPESPHFTFMCAINAATIKRSSA